MVQDAGNTSSNESSPMTHPCEYLRLEDERLVKIEDETEKWWEGKMTQDAERLRM